jgi:hypothetical protein
MIAQVLIGAAQDAAVESSSEGALEAPEKLPKAAPTCPLAAVSPRVLPATSGATDRKETPPRVSALSSQRSAVNQQNTKVTKCVCQTGVSCTNMSDTRSRRRLRG